MHPGKAWGAVAAEVNNDGNLDLFVANDTVQNFLYINPDAVGAHITYQAGDLLRTRMKAGGGSFLSSRDPRIILGAGPRPHFDWVEIRWPKPSVAVERFTNLPVNRYITLVEGTGKWT